MSRPEKFPVAGFAWKVVLLTTVVVLVVSFIQVYIVYPRFIRRTVEDCRSEAMRAARNISRIMNLDEPVARRHLTPEVLGRIVEVSEDFQLWKLKVFSPDGEVLFSTDEGDVGEINSHDYFFGNVARGEVYSKAVWEKTATLEGQVVPVDVVETYVPIMQGDLFLGAWEIYYNITERKSGLDRLIAQASMLTLGVGGALLVATIFLAFRADGAMRRQEELKDQLIRSDRLAAMGTLVGGVAHEFNNINLTVMGFSQLTLDREDLSPEVRDHLRRINRAATRASSITNNLLDFSRSRENSPGRGNLAAAAREALSLVRDQYGKEGISIRESISDLPDSVMDQDQLVQVVLNFLANARHAMLSSSRKVLSVETGSAKGKNFVRVGDTGCGIPGDRLSQVFIPFFSTKGEYAEDPGQSRVKGTGLGLSICHAIVTNHGGKIDVESREGEGTSFTVSLPLSLEHVAGGTG